MLKKIKIGTKGVREKIRNRFTYSPEAARSSQLERTVLYSM
jgi:hypothetical protein